MVVIPNSDKSISRQDLSPNTEPIAQGLLIRRSFFYTLRELINLTHSPTNTD
jgi:hypothetical protein